MLVSIRMTTNMVSPYEASHETCAKHSVLTLISLPLPNFPILPRLSIPLCNAITGNPPRSSSNVLNFDPLQTKSRQVLRSYLVYILEQRLSDPAVCDINELRSCVQILTNKGAVNPTNNPIYFTKKFGNTIDLARQLPSKKLFFSISLFDQSDFFNLLSVSPCLPVYGMVWIFFSFCSCVSIYLLPLTPLENLRDIMNFTLQLAEFHFPLKTWKTVVKKFSHLEMFNYG